MGDFLGSSSKMGHVGNRAEKRKTFAWRNPQALLFFHVLSKLLALDWTSICGFMGATWPVIKLCFCHAGPKASCWVVWFPAIPMLPSFMLHRCRAPKLDPGQPFLGGREHWSPAQCVWHMSLGEVENSGLHRHANIKPESTSYLAGIEKRYTHTYLYIIERDCA